MSVIRNMGPTSKGRGDEAKRGEGRKRSIGVIYEEYWYPHFLDLGVQYPHFSGQKK